MVVEGELFDEGATVTVLARDTDETFEVSPEQEAALLSAIAEANRGEFIAAQQLIKSIRRPA